MRLARLLTGLLFWAALLQGAPVGAQVEVAVIVHPTVTVDSLDRGQLLDYYTGDIQRWPDGVAVVVNDLKQKGDVRDSFYHFLGKRPSRMKSIWLRKMLSGEGEPPQSLATEADVVASVATTPGAVGYVGRASVTPDVHVLLHIRVPIVVDETTGK